MSEKPKCWGSNPNPQQAAENCCNDCLWLVSCRATNSALTKSKSDGSTAAYYELPTNAKELQDLIAFRNMNAQLGEIFRACYRYGMVAHSPKIRDIKKIIFYAKAELARLEKYEGAPE